MKSAFKRSLALVLTVLMVLSACTLTLQMAVFAVAGQSQDNQPCEHANTNYHTKEEPVPATCVEWGYTWNVCTHPECGKKWATDFVAPTGVHEYTETTSTAATCTQDGFTGTACVYCGKLGEGVTTPATGHNFSYVLEDKSCLESGKATVKCLNGCEEFGKGVETELPATGHNHQLVEEEVKAPTCTEKGYITYSCVYCQDAEYTFAVEFEALGHLANDEKIDKSCTTDGWEIGGICVRPNVDKFGQKIEGTCGHVIDESKKIKCTGHVDPKAQTGEGSYQAPTCGAAGYQWYVCGKCEDEWKEEINALEHNWVKGTAVAPVCSKNGFTDGYTPYTCSKCNTTEKRDWINAKHNYEIDNGQEVRYTFAAATLDANGNRIIALDANGNKTYYTVATVKCADGLRCDGCDKCEVYVTSDATFAPAGDWIQVVWVVQTAPSCGVKGILVHSCKDCEYTESLHIPSTHIKAGAAIQVVAPNCTEEGYSVYECSVCGNEFSDDYVDNKGGHLWENGERLGFDANGKPVVKKLSAQAATCTEPGRSAVEYCYDAECELNKNKGTAETPALGHKFGCEPGCAGDVCLWYVEATCAHLGYYVKGALCHNGCGEVDPNLSEAAKSYDTAVKNGLVKLDSVKPAHVWDEANPFTPAKPATCTEEGRTAVIRCVNCGGFKGGDYLPKLTHTNTVAHYDATCQSPAMNVTYCTHCAVAEFDPAAYMKAADQAAYLAGLTSCHVATVEVTGETSDNGGHWILGLPTDARVWDATIDLGGGVLGAWRYDLSAVEGTHIIPGVTDLDGDGVADYDSVKYPGQYVEGSCSAGYIQHHNAYYICGHCGELIEFSVIRVHGWQNGLTGAADCTNDQKCNDCGETLSNKTGHSYVPTVTDPTCTAQGYTTHTCANCGHSYVDSYTKATDHKHVPTVTDPTCTAAGYTTHVCSVCGDTYTDSPVDALGHSWGAAPTCTTAQVCTVCGATKADKLGHVWERTVDGKELNSDIWWYQEIVKVVYTYDEATGKVTVTTTVEDICMTREATCTLYGFEIYECSDCGELKAANFEAARGHNYVERSTAADCINDGKKWEECTVCGDKINETVIYAQGYHYNMNGEAIELNCQWLSAHTAEECTCAGVCGVTFKAEDYHQWNDKPIVTATCTEYGVQIYYCHVCDAKKILNGEDDIVPPLGHKAVIDTENSVAPTMTTTGLNVYKCERCGIAMGEPETVPALGGVIVSGSTANAWVADAKIVNNGILAYTISIEALEAKFYSLNVDLTFNNKHFTYIGYDLGADGKNIFGDLNFNFGTKVGTGLVNGDYTTIGFYGINENTVEGAKADVTLEGKQEFVTVYFRVNGDVHTNEDPKAATVVESNITLGNIVCLTAADATIDTAITNAATVEIHKLGNLSGEGLVGPEDLAAIRAHVINGTYDACADINVDGVVTMEDIRLLTQVKVYSLAYADLATKVEPFSVA